MHVTFNAERHEYHDESGVLVPNVTGILKDVGLIDGKWFTDFARDRGTAVHMATAMHDEGTLDSATVDPRIEGYVAAWVLFRKESGFVPTLVEAVVANQTPRYAGTLDRAGLMGGDAGKSCILDIKTGAIPAWAALQTAAYQRCRPNFRARYGIELRENGTYRLERFTNDNVDWMVFCGALALVNWKKNNGVT